MRTGIAVSALGFVLARFEIMLLPLAILEGQEFDESELALAIGTLLVLAGPVIVGFARSSSHRSKGGSWPPRRTTAQSRSAWRCSWRLVSR